LRGRWPIACSKRRAAGARQMNAGAAAARGEVLVFLHADTLLPDDAAGLIALGLAATRRRWGRFDVSIAGTIRCCRRSRSS
jgi:hypothetical protein